MGCSDGGHTNNGVHRCPDIMAHIGQKLTFCPAGSHGIVKGALQCLALLFLLMTLLVDPAGDEDCQLILRIGIIHMDDLCGCPVVDLIRKPLPGF